MPRQNSRYGWIPDLPDHRDFLYAAPLAVLRALPPKADLSPACPPGSTTGKAPKRPSSCA